MKHKGNKLEKTASLDAVYQSITDILEAARTTAYRSVNVAMVQAYWQIGRIIVEEEQKGHQRADYGKALIAELARRLTRDYGKGFTESNLKYMRQFYLTFPNRHALRDDLIDRLQEFLLELGKGFAYVARQRRITIDGEHFYIDLVFYNYILKCFTLIDLKIGKLTPQDIGQMDFYVRYFEQEEKQESDNPTIGLILCSDKNEAMVKYTLLEDNQRIFASKYKLYLPTEEELQRELLDERAKIELERVVLNK